MNVPRQYFVYLLASRKNGTLYCGMTNNLVRRAFEHREGLVEGFTRKHGVKTLVWFETHATAGAAITREKQIKEWQRGWKIELIESENPEWHDLFDSLV